MHIIIKREIKSKQNVGETPILIFEKTAPQMTFIRIIAIGYLFINHSHAKVVINPKNRIIVVPNDAERNA